MRTVRHAVFGAMLASASVAQADVITDWNQTAIEVMKTANVAGNPWTRSMAMMNVAMSEAAAVGQIQVEKHQAEIRVFVREAQRLPDQGVIIDDQNLHALDRYVTRRVSGALTSA